MKASEYDKLTVAQKNLLDQYEKRLESATEALQQEAPEHVVKLGAIIRKSVANGSLVKFKRFLGELDIYIPGRDLEAFRDHLIIHRIDLKDLEPVARARIFSRAHSKEDPSNMTSDFRQEMDKGVAPKCRNCRWFIIAPNDSDCNGTKSCVEMGTKGTDIACYGFRHPPN